MLAQKIKNTGRFFVKFLLTAKTVAVYMLVPDVVILIDTLDAFPGNSAMMTLFDKLKHITIVLFRHFLTIKINTIIVNVPKEEIMIDALAGKNFAIDRDKHLF